MGKAKSLVALTILQLVLQLISGELTQVASRIFNNPISNVLRHQDSIYIADSEQIHKLDKNLGIEISVPTCETEGCKNVMKVFVMFNNSQLITCGTGKGGICQSRRATDMTILKDTEQLGLDKAIVTTQEERPAIGYTENDHILIAATYGPGFGDNHQKFYAISTRSTSSPFFDARQSLTIKKGSVNPNDYLIYFKEILESSGFIFLVTNQKQYFEGTNGNFPYVSKLMRICKSDIVPSDSALVTISYRSYTDIQINCDLRGKSYNLIQDAIMVEYEGETYFIASFASGTDPEDHSGARVICAKKLSDIQESIVKAQIDFGNATNHLTEDQRYFPKNWLGSEGEAINCSNLLDLYNYVIGTEALQLRPIYEQPSSAGSISKLFGRTLQPGLLDIHIGTSDGKLKQTNFLGLNKYLEEYHETTVHQGFPIVSVLQQTDNLYVISEKKAIRYDETDCSEFTTCAAMMQVGRRNPLCGWCVLEGRSKKKDASCILDKWISALDEDGCVTLTLEPPGQNIQAGPGGKVTLKMPRFDTQGNVNSFDYQCEYTGSVNKTETANGALPNSLKCDVPASTDLGGVTLSVWVTVEGRRVFLASTEFLYFDCSTYKSCGACAATPGASCAWCPGDNTCKKPSDICNAGTSTGIIVRDNCPLLTSVEPMYIPSGQATNLTIQATNLVKNVDGTYACKIKGQSFAAEVASNTITCVVTVSGTMRSSENRVDVEYTKGTSKTTLDEAEGSTVVVNIYSCGVLGEDCSHCSQLNSARYKCKWCGATSRCMYEGNSCTEESCGPPVIDSVDPQDGTHRGGTVLTIKGKNLGKSLEDIEGVTVAGVTCTNITVGESSSGGDYENAVPISIKCITKAAGSDVVGIAGDVSVTVLSTPGVKVGAFTYKKPDVTALTPDYGPCSGGTRVTLIGTNLIIGNNNWEFFYNAIGDARFTNCDTFIKGENQDVILCDIPFSTNCENNDLDDIWLKMDNYSSAGQSERFGPQDWFKRKANPTDISVQTASGILSGGNIITVQGKYLNNAHNVYLKSTYPGEAEEGKCDMNAEGTIAECKVPPASDQLKSDLSEILEQEGKSGRRRRATDCTGCVSVEVVIHLDGVQHTFELLYYQDPEYNQLGDKEVFRSETKRLILTGKNLNLVVDKNGVNVTIGLGNCDVVKLTETTLECAAPKDQPQSGIPGSSYPEVNVTVGNLQRHLGYLQYEIDKTIEQIQIIAGAVGGAVFFLIVIEYEIDKTIEQIQIIAGAVGRAVLFLIVIGVVFGIWKYKKVGKKAQELNNKLDDMEMEIKSVAKEEFFHMHSTMSGVNKSLVEQGFPYHGYQQYAFNTMFAADYMDNHPLLHEPVVSNGKVSDDTRIKLKKAMETFDQLILNRFFLVSVLTTMERQKKFFLKEKCNLAGNLCAILLGRMEYLQEVMSVLMTNLVEESTGKRTQKILFRRCESITEKLLNNWLYLCQYPHVKESFGSPLYLMFKAMQLTIESGPIDAETAEAKYTLTEERLLRKWNNNSEEGAKDPKLEAKPLTLNVVVDQGQDMFTCKVLDCDTITQVKYKCMTQIYVNFPASQLEIDPEELNLEWHEGFGGSLNLQDEDNTSARDGEWLRINTLAHYSVKDKANMALVDPRAQEEGQENYVNLAQIQTDVDCNGSMDSTEPLTVGHDEENPQEIKRWHLVKQETDTSKQQKSLIAELYLNRLFTTKQCIMEYLRHMFDVLLDKDKCPPTTMFLYNFLDELAEKNKVDQDTVHLWKSHSYIIRVWAKLVQRPSDIFDVDVPPYVDSSMDVLGQVLIDSCSLTPQKHTKDSPPQKLIFMNEVNHYRDKVRDFFQDVQNSTQRQEDLREYLADINKMQLSNCQFNKMSALYRFYQQLEPYLDDIVDDLQLTPETSRLELDKKFQQVVSVMEAEDDE